MPVKLAPPAIQETTKASTQMSAGSIADQQTTLISSQLNSSRLDSSVLLLNCDDPLL
jgi:hypothetical protein